MVENEISIGKTCLQCIKALKANEISIGKTFDLEMVNSKQSPFEADWSKIFGLKSLAYTARGVQKTQCTIFFLYLRN